MEVMDRVDILVGTSQQFYPNIFLYTIVIAPRIISYEVPVSVCWKLFTSCPMLVCARTMQFILIYFFTIISVWEYYCYFSCKNI